MKVGDITWTRDQLAGGRVASKFRYTSGEVAPKEAEQMVEELGKLNSYMLVEETGDIPQINMVVGESKVSITIEGGAAVKRAFEDTFKDANIEKGQEPPASAQWSL